MSSGSESHSVMSGFKKALDGTSSDGAISKFGDIDKEEKPKR